MRNLNDAIQEPCAARWSFRRCEARLKSIGPVSPWMWQRRSTPAASPKVHVVAPSPLEGKPADPTEIREQTPKRLERSTVFSSDGVGGRPTEHTLARPCACCSASAPRFTVTDFRDRHSDTRHQLRGNADVRDPDLRKPRGSLRNRHLQKAQGSDAST